MKKAIISLALVAAAVMSVSAHAAQFDSNAAERYCHNKAWELTYNNDNRAFIETFEAACMKGALNASDEDLEMSAIPDAQYYSYQVKAEANPMLAQRKAISLLMYLMGYQFFGGNPAALKDAMANPPAPYVDGPAK
ncbi:TPA: hypothetical protein LU109_003588 [Enterobacter hormaechei subsp. xiangfangensis]|nr:hypothetical protein [Enterobacter hormaechei subsp. xiangfangensis]